MKYLGPDHGNCGHGQLSKSEKKCLFNASNVQGNHEVFNVQIVNLFYLLS